MKKILLLLVACLPFVLSAQITPPYVVINEVNSDNPGGPDTSEFLELYGNPNTSLDSLVVVFYNGQNGLSYASYDLDGYSLDANGFFTIGDAGAAGVDITITNASLQNGADGLAIYVGDATDFPNNTAPTTTNLVDAVVYGTNDAAATNLITGLGLDILIPGYTQLDETAQTAGADLSLQRIPDGGNAFEISTFQLVVITPHTWNQPPCGAGNVVSDVATDYCDNLASIVVNFSADTTAFGENNYFAITTANDTIIAFVTAGSYDFTGFAAGTYHIYNVAYNGTADATTTAAGSYLFNITAGNCVSISTSFATVNIVPCGGCVAGDVTLTAGGSSFTSCAGDASAVLDFSNTSTSLAATYVYAVADTAGNILFIQDSAPIDFTTLDAGTYFVYGVSYIGALDFASTMVGMPVSGINASTCAEVSVSFVTINLAPCTIVDPCTQVFISEYLEGNGSNKALEIYNPTLSAIDLSSFSVEIYSNGSPTVTSTVALAGTIAPLSTYVIVNPGQGGGGTNAGLLAQADLTTLALNYNGNDAVALMFNGAAIDVIGVIGVDPGATGWLVGAASTTNNDLVRQIQVTSPADNWLVGANQYDTFGVADYTHIGNHTFNTCFTDVLVGFASSSASVQETAGTLTINLIAYNVVDSTAVEVTFSGTADGTDFTVVAPVILSFNDSTLTASFNMDIVDDLITEGAETIVMTLSSNSTITWLTQTITITILGNDPNCDGGTIAIASGANTVTQCSDLPNPTVDLSNTTTFPTANYMYVVATNTDQILSIEAGPSIDMDSYPAGSYHIWGLSYTGTLDPTTTADSLLVSGINADSCATISSNFITVNRSICVVFGCDGGSVQTFGGSTFLSYCANQGGGPLAFVNSSLSVDDLYTYYLTNAGDSIVSEILDATLDVTTLAPGTYHIWGVSYQGDLDPTTIVEGTLIDSVAASTCSMNSLNYVILNIVDCGAVQGCSQLFFSEYLEGASGNRAIEIFNPLPVAVDLANYTVNLYGNGSPTPTASITPIGLIQPNTTFLIVNPGGGPNTTDPALLALADTISNAANFSGNDAVELTYNGTAIDLIGIIGVNPGNGGWLFGNGGTANHDLVRRVDVVAGSTDWTLVSGEFDIYDPSDWSHLGVHDYEGCGVISLPTVGFAVDSQSIGEGGGSAHITVVGNNVTAPITLTIDVAGTAIYGLDYNTPFPINITLSPGASTQTFDVIILQDTNVEGPETVVMTASANVFAFINFEVETLTIADDDFEGVAEVTSQQVVAYPNPVTETLNIKSESNITSITVFDISGRKVYSEQNIRSVQQMVDFSSMSAGQYIVEVQMGDQIVHMPVSKK